MKIIGEVRNFVERSASDAVQKALELKTSNTTVFHRPKIVRLEHILLFLAQLINFLGGAYLVVIPIAATLFAMRQNYCN